MPIFIVPCFKKCIVQRNCGNVFHAWVVDKAWIDVEEDGHVDRFALVQSLLLEAEALDFAEVRGDLARGDAVRSHADDVLVALVGSSVECQSRLARKDAHLALLGHKFPG